MSNSGTLTLLSNALTLVERWAAPLAATDTKVTSDGLSIGYESDPDVGGWSGVADASTADFGALLATLLRTGAVEHLQQTLRTSITVLTETGAEDDPAVHLGRKTAHEVLIIADSLASDEERRRKSVEDTSAAADLRFERFLSNGEPMPDIDLNYRRDDRDIVAEDLRARFGQPTS